MGVSHSVCNSVYDIRSVFSLNRINFVENSQALPSHLHWLHQVWRKFFSHQHVAIVVEDLILNKIILFILYYFILFCYTHDVRVRYTVKVLCSNWTCYCGQMEQTILLFILIIVIVTDIIVTRQDVISPFYLYPSANNNRFSYNTEP